MCLYYIEGGLFAHHMTEQGGIKQLASQPHALHAFASVEGNSMFQAHSIEHVHAQKKGSKSLLNALVKLIRNRLSPLQNGLKITFKPTGKTTFKPTLVKCALLVAFRGCARASGKMHPVCPNFTMRGKTQLARAKIRPRRGTQSKMPPHTSTDLPT